MKARLLAVLFLLLAAAAILWKNTRPAPSADPRTAAAGAAAGETPRRDAPPAGSTGSASDTNPREPKKPGDALASTDKQGPAVTKSTRRNSVTSPDGVRRAIIDPMASWSELPAWPEGPRVFAEVDTGSRRYVNLRPDDVGEMPRIRAQAEERIELRVNFPDGEPGEKIFVELPNGGSFADSDARGRVFELPENRTLSFPYVTDDARGHCNVKLRHRGHTRSLPIWVGELPETETAHSQPIPDS